MPRRPFRRGLLTSLTALVVLPMLMAMTLGMSALLRAVGDATAAAVCQWVALAFGIVWGASVVTTAALTAFLALDDRRPHRRRRRLRSDRLGPQVTRPE